MDQPTFEKNVNIAKKTYDYSDETRSVKKKAKRLQAINEIIKSFTDKSWVEQLQYIQNIRILMDMIKVNIFRPLPNTDIYKENLPFMDINRIKIQEPDIIWPHIKGIYEIFYQLVFNEACDATKLEEYVTSDFIKKLLKLFDSESIEERDYLKNILHKFYVHFVQKRKMIRKEITDCFHSFIQGIHRLSGASELLEIMASIIPGLMEPLKEEHVNFFNNIIIPLHKVQAAKIYFGDNLIKCSISFLKKDSTLSFPLLEAILKYWPDANYTKITDFLQELPQVLEFCDLEKIQPLVKPLFKRVVNCISGSHLLIADNAMCLFKKKIFLTILKKYKTISFNILAPTVNYLTGNHCDEQIRDSIKAVKEILQKIDSQAYINALETANKKRPHETLKIPKPIEKRKEIEQNCKNFSKIDEIQNSSYFAPFFPFADDYVI